jgi:Integrase zinc binding domain
MMSLNYTIQYKKGCENMVADALSRRDEITTDSAQNIAVTELIPTWIEELRSSYDGDEWAQVILKGEGTTQVNDHTNVHIGVIRYKGRLYVGTGSNWRCKIMSWMHDSNIGGHLGILGTNQRTKKLFYWPRLKEEVITHVKACDVCLMNKSENSPPQGYWIPTLFQLVLGSSLQWISSMNYQKVKVSMSLW